MASPRSLGLPSLDQVWLLALELQTEFFRACLDVFRGRIVMLLQKGINSSAIERHQGLNQVPAVDSGAMIGGRKLAQCSYPQLVFVTEVPLIFGRNPLELCMSVCGEYRFQDVRQFGSATQK